MHHFSDASQLAYGACSYLRLVNENGFVHCSFLIGKSRLAPLKTVSIPRLELTAAVLAVKLDSMLRKELKVEITATTFWCDSTAVLQILANSTKRFPTFVANRIATIERMVSPNSSWRHVPTQLNPADLASRGLTAENVVNDQIWLHAPDYLWNLEDCWPQKLDMTTFQLPLELLSASSQMVSTSLTQTENSSMDRLLSRYSSFFSLLKGASWLIRYKSFLLSKVRKTSLPKFNRSLAVEELIVAENNLIRYIPRDHFGFLIKKLDSD